MKKSIIFDFFRLLAHNEIMKKKQPKDPNKASLFRTFLYFLKVGFLTFGGGYAIIAMLEKELVDKKKWVTEDEMMNMIAIGESTPGPIAINLATFIGYKLHKFWGAFFCTLGFVLPSFTIISIVSVCKDYVVGVPVIQWFFKGVRAGVVILIGNACLKFFKKMDKTWFTFLLLFAAFFVSFFTSLSAVYLILIGGALGFLYAFTVAKIKEKKEKTAKVGVTTSVGEVGDTVDNSKTATLNADSQEGSKDLVEADNNGDKVEQETSVNCEVSSKEVSEKGSNSAENKHEEIIKENTLEKASESNTKAENMAEKEEFAGRNEKNEGEEVEK
mgnify:CR=1 FL=1